MSLTSSSHNGHHGDDCKSEITGGDNHKTEISRSSPSDSQSLFKKTFNVDQSSMTKITSSCNASSHQDNSDIGIDPIGRNVSTENMNMKHSHDDGDGRLAACSHFKRFKSAECHNMNDKRDNASEKLLTLSRQNDALKDLLDAGRNMRYCEEDDAFITSNSQQLSSYMESGNEEDFKTFLLPDKNLFLFLVMDVVLPELKKSTCFTKRYGHYIEGAGSVVQMSSNVQDTKAASALKSRTVDLKNKHEWGEQEVSTLRKLKLRYFTPREVANLLCFPSEFCFPQGFNNVQKYRVLGNSLNVYVVSELIKFMVAV